MVRRPNDKGIAMTLVIVIIIILTMLAAYVTSLAYNQRRVTDTAGGGRAKIYYRAKAGVVEANWRIRTNYTAGLTPGSFLIPTYDPAPYTIDVDEDGTADCQIDIGPADGTGKRAINSTGLDV